MRTNTAPIKEYKEIKSIDDIVEVVNANLNNKFIMVQCQ